MKTMILTLKGILLWLTFIAIILFISGIDSILVNNYFAICLSICTILCYSCYKLISKDELKLLSLIKWIA